MKIDGTAAVVTGGASGLGEATARALAAKGAKVAVFDRDPARIGQKVGGLEVLDVSDLPAAVVPDTVQIDCKTAEVLRVEVARTRAGFRDRSGSSSARARSVRSARDSSSRTGRST